MTIRTYTSPQSFKQALEQRLRTAASDGAALVRKRQLLVFDRFLARAVAILGDTVLLKGGLVLELRLERARTTKDIDLRVTGSPETVLAQLQEAGRKDLGDFMAFEVTPDTEQSTIQNDGMQYEGLRSPLLPQRFSIRCWLARTAIGSLPSGHGIQPASSAVTPSYRRGDRASTDRNSASIFWGSTIAVICVLTHRNLLTSHR